MPTISFYLDPEELAEQIATASFTDDAHLKNHAYGGILTLLEEIDLAVGDTVFTEAAYNLFKNLHERDVRLNS